MVKKNFGYGKLKKAAYGELSPSSNNALPFMSSKTIEIVGKKDVFCLIVILFICSYIKIYFFFNEY